MLLFMLLLLHYQLIISSCSVFNFRTLHVAMTGIAVKDLLALLALGILLLLIRPCLSNIENLQGHMERLGLQRKPEGHVEILNELPSPLEFFDKYVSPGKPVVFKGAAKEMPAFKNWNDEYLR